MVSSYHLLSVLCLFIVSDLFSILQISYFKVFFPSKISVDAVWTKFDLVRPRVGAWGSNGTTPFFRIERPTNHSNPTDTGTDAKFGYSVCNLGDIDKNGYDDIAVGAIGETVNNHTNAGGVYIFLMNGNHTYSSYRHINGMNPHEPRLTTGDQFGYSLACIGDLNGDGVFELAVGAPGYIISSVYILYLYKTGEVLDYRLIRGAYGSVEIINGTSTNTTNTVLNETYTVNGPPIVYGSRFGSALAFLEINTNYYCQLAVGSLASTGENVVFLLYLNTTGWVQTYSVLTPEMAGIKAAYSNFGSSIVLLPKIHPTDRYFTLAIGASKLYEVGSINTEAGSVLLYYIDEMGKVNHTRLIGERSSLATYGISLPFQPYESFGSALATVGDINRDNFAQRHPLRPNWKNLPSIPDLIVGAPQSKSSAGTGHIYFIYLDVKGEMAGYTELPAVTDKITNISLQAYEQFGAAVAGYQDLDKNGLKEVIVGAPSRENEEKVRTGCVYILFPRRRRYHPKPFDYVRYYLIITLPTGLFTLFCCMGTMYFCWYFRRRPDEVEIIVKKSGLQVDPSKPRQKYVRPNVVYIEEYPP